MTTKEEKALAQFKEELDALIEKWRDNQDLSSEILMYSLILEAKIEACWLYDNYFEAFGSLVDAVTNDFNEMFHHIADDFKDQS